MSSPTTGETPNQAVVQMAEEFTAAGPLRRPGLGGSGSRVVAWAAGAIGASVDDVRTRWALLPQRSRLLLLALLASLGAAGAGYLTAANPYAAPPGIAVVTRVWIIVTLVAAGIYALTSRVQSKMGELMIASGFFSILWLLNGSSNSVAFSVGAVLAGLAPTLFCYITLVHPFGRASSTERRTILGAGGLLFAMWLALVMMAPKAPVGTPLMGCGQHCPDNIFFLGVRSSALSGVLTALLILVWFGVTWWTAARVIRHYRGASGAVRNSLAPVAFAAVLNAALLVAYFAVKRSGWSGAGYFGAAYVNISILIPLAVLFGLTRERFYMAGALADFVRSLTRSDQPDPQALMASALGDPSLQIAYWRPQHDTCVDQSGVPVTASEGVPGRAVSWIERDGRRIAAVSYSSDLRDLERFVQAAGSTALMYLEAAQLQADLRASTAELAASRVRLVEAAHEERRRIERDLHDTIQQQIVGVRLRLELATDMLKDDPHRGEQMLEGVGEQIDEVLETLRNLARGIYPALLTSRGIATALRAAGQRLPIAVSVRADRIGRYPEDIEVAVYFCCLEALQNTVKHAGPDASANVRLWQDGAELCFEVADTGFGFDLEAADPGSGLTNMRDRIEAVGGSLTIRAGRGLGTRISGRVPASLALVAPGQRHTGIRHVSLRQQPNHPSP